MVIRHLPIMEGRNNLRHKGQRPNWFDYNNCFDSLFTSIKTIPNERLKIKILFDGDRNDFYQDILYKYTEKFENIDVVYINGGSEMASGIILHNYIKSLKLPGEDLIYFVENDYLHSKNWYHQFMQFNNLIKDWGFVTLFNHPNEIPINIIQIDSMKWGEIYSTTGTYIVKAGVYNQLSLYYKLLRKDYRFFKIACRGIGFKMFTPIPTLAQHAMKGDISPTFDLENFNNQE